MTLTVMFLFWLSSSYIEYKIVLGYPRLRPLFRGIPGIVISLAIGMVLAWAVGASNALPIVAAQMIGLATNEFMFAFFYRMEHKVIPSVKRANNKVRDIKAKHDTVKADHPHLYSNAKESMIAGAKTVGAFFALLLWIIGLPIVIWRRIRLFAEKVKGWRPTMP